jgi:hypothetical protein
LREISLPFRIPKMREQDLADAGAIGFELGSFTNVEVVAAEGAIGKIGHHVVFEHAQMRVRTAPLD